ncbi:MAG: hypothetical protein JEZ06_02350 [Anaerolineaceae bacterium]|nr:hypothetical protein [Anaerolineaceae bacterium]
MVKINNETFSDLECVKLDNGTISTWLTKSVGPRIIGLSAFGSSNILAILPDSKADFEGVGTYFFRGGHRLWYGPEVPQTTYLPDNDPLEIQSLKNGLRVTQPVDKIGIQKSIIVELAESAPEIVINHFLTNTSNKTVELAPWAITQIRKGGVGIFPQQSGPTDPYGLLPNRHFVLWPYTKISSPHIQWEDEVFFINANLKEGALKIGFPNTAGWQAYAMKDGNLFVKRMEYQKEAEYLDRGSSSETYCCPDFIELESLSPLQRLAPGSTSKHQEIWQLYQKDKWPEEISNLFKLYKG